METLQFGIEIGAWSAGRGGHALLDELTGEARIDFVSIAAATGPVAEFHLASQRERPFFHTRGGWHFRPTTNLYEASGIRPTVAEWVGRHEALPDLVQHVRGLGLAAWLSIDVAGIAGLVDAELATTRNAWGDPFPGGAACLSSPQFRELVRGLVQDLARFEPDGLILDGLLLDVPRYERLMSATERNPAALLDFCFCASCREIAERAGVDPDQSARSMRATAEALADAREQVTHDGLWGRLMHDEVLRTYCEARNRDAAAWMERVRQVAPPTFWLRRSERAESRSIATPIGRFESSVKTILKSDDPMRNGAANWWQKVRIAMNRLDWAGLSLSLAGLHGGQSAEFVRLVQDACDGEYALFEFRDLGAAPRETAGWLKQAIRFARRRSA